MFEFNIGEHGMNRVSLSIIFIIGKYMFTVVQVDLVLVLASWNFLACVWCDLFVGPAVVAGSSANGCDFTLDYLGAPVMAGDLIYRVVFGFMAF